jgi:hypothetical protein
VKAGMLLILKKMIGERVASARTVSTFRMNKTAPARHDFAKKAKVRNEAGMSMKRKGNVQERSHASRNAIENTWG